VDRCFIGVRVERLSCTVQPVAGYRLEAQGCGDDIGYNPDQEVDNSAKARAGARQKAVYFYGSRATLAGDVRGIGWADLVAVSDNNTFVLPSSGTGFGQVQGWSSGAFYGIRATLLGDVNNDRKLDLVAVNNDSVWVMLSNGTAFVPQTTPWLTTSSPPPYGTRATLVGNEAVARWADLVAVTDGNIDVMTSDVRPDGTGYFDPPVLWSSEPFYGTPVTL
jgi:hypothetical protein